MPSAAEIAHALCLKGTRATFSGACPSCGYRGFKVQERDGRTFVKCHAGGCKQAAVIHALREADLWDGRPNKSPVGRSDVHPPPRDDPSAGILRLWRATRLAEGTLVALYLRSRGHRGPLPQDLRFLPAAKHTESGSLWPTMIAAVRHVAKPGVVALHRTFLRPDGKGKAPVSPNKKTLGRVSGAAVRLAPAAEPVAVTEGIESGLAVLAATQIPTWAALSAGGIRALVLPPLPLAAAVTICADHDPVGIAAAQDAAERWHREGRRVRIAVPPEPGTDFNDLSLSMEAGS